MKQRLLTPTEKDEDAWAKIVDHLISEFFEEEEGKTIFLTRCAESAQEALAEGEKRRAALERYENTLKVIKGNSCECANDWQDISWHGSSCPKKLAHYALEDPPEPTEFV